MSVLFLVHALGHALKHAKLNAFVIVFMEKNNYSVVKQ